MAGSSKGRKVLRLLIADDNPINLKMLAHLLESMQINYEAVEDGDAVLRLLAAQSAAYDLLLLDCLMPILDGFETTRQIRAETAFAQLKIVGVTTVSIGNDRERCLGAGMDEFLTKPVQRAELERVLQKFWPQSLAPKARLSSSSGSC